MACGRPAVEGEQAGQDAKSNVDEGIDKYLELGIECMCGQGNDIKGVEARLMIDGEKAGKEERATGEKEEHEFHPGISSVAAAPYQDEGVHGHDGDFVKEEKEEEVQRHEDAKDADDEEYHKGEIFFDALFEVPHGEYPGEIDDGIEHDEDNAKSVNAEVIGNANGRDPGDHFFKLNTPGCGIITRPELQTQHTGQQAAEGAYQPNAPHSLLGHEQKDDERDDGSEKYG